MTEIQAARQFWVRSPGKGEISSAPLAPPRDGEILIHTLYSGISRGTEALVFLGDVPPSQYEVMRAPFQEGRLPAPVKYGYASVGRVAVAPAPSPGTVPDVLPGRVVFCLFPHQDAYCVPAEAVTPLPEGLPPERAVLAANMETAVNAVWDGCPLPGDRIVVVGGGVVGMLIAWLCRQVPGTRVTLVDVNPHRAGPAGELGVPFRSEMPAEANADLVIHASGDPGGLEGALALAGAEGTVLEVSWYGRKRVSLPLGEHFHSRRLTLKSSQVGVLPAARTPRWDRARRMGLALDLLRTSSLDALITGESDFEELPRVMEELSRDPGDQLCHRVRYPPR